MRLKKIEILGFKSFKDRTRILFSPGTSAIVGPNGCGKSNIVDAMRWVMGEQRVTLLRGKKMEDVIFNGSDDTPPVGMAEVSITLENNGQRFNSAYADCAEVTVSRKLYRDGESEYAINNVPCRLLDVREFFMDAGVGARTYSIVEQEKVFRLIEAKPEERRLFIEEAAGIAKYRLRKESAVRKMEATKQNLLRLNDIVSEVKSQLNAVSRQAKKAERFKTLKQTIRESQLLLSLDLLLELNNRKEELEKERRSLEKRRLEAETSVASLESSIEEIQSRIAENETEADTVQEAFFNVKNDITLHEQQIEFSKKTLDDLAKRETAGNRTVEDLQRRREEVLENITALKKELEASEASLRELRDLIVRQKEAVDLLRNEEETTRETLDREKNRHVEAAAENARLRNLAASLEKELETLRRKREQELVETTANRERITALKRQASELKASLDAESREQKKLRERGEACRIELENERHDLAAVNDDIEEIKEEIGKKSSRLASLKEIQENMDWCTEGTRHIMKEARKPSWTGGALRGLAADYLDVPPEYEAAVEAALGDKIQSVLVEHPEDGILAIDHLKSNSAGRSSFLPLEYDRREGPLAGSANIPPQAVPLTQVVNITDDEQRIFAERLLGDVLLVPDLRTASELRKLNGFIGTFVTPEGDIVSPNGVMTGGSGNNGGYSLLRNKREINGLQEEIRTFDERLKAARNLKTGISSRIESREEELEGLRTTFHEKELLISEKKKDIERIEGEISWIDQRITVLAFNTETMEREETEAETRIVECRNDMAHVETKIIEDQNRITELQEQWKDVAFRLKEEEQTLVENKIALSTLEEKRESGARSLKNLEDSVVDIESRIADGFRDMEMCRKNIGTTRDELKSLEEKLVLLYADYERAGENLSKKKDQQESLEAIRRERESLLQNERKTLESLSRDTHRVSLDIQEVTLQITGLKTNVQERYHQDLQELIPTFEPLGEERKKELERKLESDRKRLEDFGDVNLLALNEYEELKERHEFLSSQTQDLETSLETLQKTISRINRISRKRFAETFDAVSDNFKQVFPRLFPGGKGKLMLTDESDLLETGVDIEIQIPGKKPQNLSLLSGGEKSLAAVSLILSILMFRPTPFLILDEADSPLDDSNVSLFTGLIGEVASDSQIIFITHNKRTMETADNLIGVTMQKSGVSTIVSVNMH